MVPRVFDARRNVSKAVCVEPVRFGEIESISWKKQKSRSLERNFGIFLMITPSIIIVQQLGIILYFANKWAFTIKVDI